MKSVNSRSTVLAALLALAALVVAPRLGAERAAGQAAQSGAAAITDLYSALEFRNLESAFSRGGRVTAVAGVTSNEQLYYMGSTGGGVWRTEDAGKSWTNISDGFFEAGGIGAISVAESDANVIYVGTGSACPRGNVSPGIGMYKSSDAGKTWQHVGLRNAGQIGRIKIHPTNPDIAYVAVLGNIFGPSKERGVYRTQDGGKTWQLVHFISDRTGAIDITMNPQNPNILIAAMWTTERKPWTIESGSSEGGLFRTTDGGNTWEKLTQGLPNKVMVGKIGVSISPANPQRVYAQVEAANDEGGTFRSDDGGTTWTRTFTSRNLQQRAWYYTHIFADTGDADTVYGFNVGPFRSTDGGKTFTGAPIRSHSDYHDLWINPKNPKAMIAGNDGGATVTTDGGTTWSPQNNQPTSEIYRVTVDSRWPYWVYGAQQDNSTVAVPSLGNAPTYDVGGGESGWIAVDPRDPDIFYAGNYGGSIDRTDRNTGISTDVRVYADSQTGQRAADMKYRFQWNAPIMISPHTPDVVYTTSQVVHRTRNGGLDWEVISPDLTRNDKTKQQYSGGEGITRDNTGVEVYGTIFVLEESPIAPGNLWAGSDDGLVHISRDNGKTWTNITPAGAPEGAVNAISLSTHDPGRAHMAMYRYRQNDRQPYLYQTNDYGKTWKRIADGTNGIPDWHFTRVIREDTERRGLLYAGTEFGLYVSFDDGARWHPLQLNLPRTPVSDLKVYRGALIVSTQGRSFWILDDLAPLRAIAAAQLQTQNPMLYKPGDASRTGLQPAAFYYWLPQAPTSPVTVEISDAAGQVVYTTTAEPGAPRPSVALGGGGRGGFRGGGRGGRGGAPGAAPVTASAIQGLNRAVWPANAMRLPAPYTALQGAVMWGAGGNAQGPKVPPGQYTVKVTNGGWTQSQTFMLKGDPRYTPEMTIEEGKQQLDMALEVGGWIKTLYDGVLSIRDVKKQVAALTEKAGAKSPVAAAAKTLTDKLTAVEGDITQLQGEGGQDALNFPGRMDNQLIVLYSSIIAPDRRLGSPVIERYNDLKPQAATLMQRLATGLKDDVAAFNAVATKAKLAPVVVK